MDRIDAPIIFGTAGHIDHGKTTLTRALTGLDTDRLPEEKARGISIDLGFAHFSLPGGRPAALIDVPGHERFVRNMVAGVHGMDAVMLVIAADEGVMPQTKEHLDILSLLGVQHGLTVMTKADLVDEEWLQVSREVVQEALSGTFLENEPIITVDAVSGRGLEELKEALAVLAEKTEPRSASGPARLPVDRVFSVKGFGSVVTGTLVAGTISLEDTLSLVPGERTVRVRGIEVHGQKSRRARAGQRVALNIAGVDRENLTRGQVLATHGTVQGAEVFTAQLRLLSSAPPLAMNSRVHCHVGTAESVGRLYLYQGDQIEPGDQTFVEVRLETPIAVVRHERFLIRSYSPVITIGGGTILEVGIRHRRKEPGLLSRLDKMARGSEQDVVRDVMMGLARPESLAVIAKNSGMTVEETRIALGALDGVIHDEERVWWWKPHLEQLREKLVSQLERFHREREIKVGIPRDKLRAEWGQGWSPRDFAWVIEQMDGIVLDREWVRLADHRPRLNDEAEREVKRVYRLIHESGLRPVSLDDALGTLVMDPERFYDILEYLGLANRIVRLDEGLYISRETFEQGLEVVRRAFQGQDQLGTADLKAHLDTNRRYAVLFLELLDSLRVTRRIGEKRVLVN